MIGIGELVVALRNEVVTNSSARLFAEDVSAAAEMQRGQMDELGVPPDLAEKTLLESALSYVALRVIMMRKHAPESNQFDWDHLTAVAYQEMETYVAKAGHPSA